MIKSGALLTVLGILLSLVIALAYAVPKDTREAIEKLIQLTSRREFVKASFKISVKITEWAFGPSIISLRAFAVSCLCSGIFYVLFGEIAISTTEWLKQSIKASDHTIPLPYPHLSLLELMADSATDPVRIAHAATTVVVLLVTLIAEFFYVSKTRILLKRVILNSETKLKFFPFYLPFFILDICTTYFLLFISIPLIIIITLFVLQIFLPDIDISRSYFIASDWYDVNTGREDVIVEFPFSNYDIWPYFQMVFAVGWLLFNEINYRFMPYFLLNMSVIWKHSSDMTSDVLITLPFTTIIATAFSTTISVSIVSVVVMFYSIVMRIPHTFGLTVNLLHRKEIWTLIIISFLVFAVLMTAAFYLLAN